VLDIVAVSRTGVHVFERAGLGNYVETAAAQLTEWQPVRAEIVDADGTGGAELIVLSTVWSYPGASRVQRFDAGLNVSSSFDLPWLANTLAVEPSPTPRKNLVVPRAHFSGPSQLVVVDAVNGHVIWRSPLLRGASMLDFVTLPGEAQQRVTLANEFGVYLTR
jgi:hypothetical protein